MITVVQDSVATGHVVKTTPAALSAILSHENYLRVISGHLEVYLARTGLKLNPKALVEDGATIELRSPDSTPFFRPTGWLSDDERPSPTENVREVDAFIGLAERVLATVQRPAWLLDLVAEQRAAALQNDRAMVTSTHEFTHKPACAWTSRRRWFHHGAPDPSFDPTLYAAARRLLATMPSVLVIPLVEVRATIPTFQVLPLFPPLPSEDT